MRYRYKRKRYSYRRKSFKRGRYARRARRPYGRYRRARSSAMHFKRTGPTITMQFAPTAIAPDFFYQVAFQINDVVASSEFSLLFDQYRLNCVGFKLVPKDGVPMADGSTFNRGLPQWHMVYDYDDIGTPSSISDMSQYANYKTFQLPRSKGFKIFPAVAASVYNSAVSSGYGQRRKQWIDWNYPNVPHFGLKLAINDGVNGQTYSYTFRTTYYFSCKGIR